jgi:hypothetical protein
MQLPNRELKLYELAEWLVKLAVQNQMCGCPDKFLYERALQQGTELPEKAKPGYRIMTLPERLRESVKQLKSEHFNHRI